MDDDEPDVTPENFYFACGAFLVHPRQYGKSVVRRLHFNDCIKNEAMKKFDLARIFPIGFLNGFMNG